MTVRGFMLVLCMTVVGVCVEVQAQTPPKNPAVVDGAPFAALGARTDKVVDMDVDEAVLNALAKRYKPDNAELARFIDDLTLIKSVVVEFGGVAPVERIDAQLAKLQKTLKDAKWRRLVSIREPDLQVLAFVYMKGDDIAGLVIVSVETKRLVFSNLVGSIDLTRLARLRGTLSVPGLDRLPTKMEPEQPAAEERP